MNPALAPLCTPLRLNAALTLRKESTLGETLSGTPGVSSTYFGPNASRPIIRGQDGDRIRILHARDFDALDGFVSFRTARSDEHDGGNALFAAMEYWDDPERMATVVSDAIKMNIQLNNKETNQHFH